MIEDGVNVDPQNMAHPIFWILLAGATNVNHSTICLANPLEHSSILEVEISTVELEPGAVAQLGQTHPHAAAEGSIGKSALTSGSLNLV